MAAAGTTADGFADEFADAQLAAYVAAAGAFDDLDVAAIRAAIDQRATRREPGPAMPVTEHATPGGPARLYRPTEHTRSLVLYLHGGGWAVGSVRSFDRPLRRLAASSGAAVLGLDYRLAPEHRWPASVDDTVAALRWIAGRPPELGTVDRVAVAGDSAGGLLAALACLRLRDEAPDALPRLQVMLYANADLVGGYASETEKATGYGLTTETERFFADLWLPGPEYRSRPDVSPMQAPDLRGLPAAVVITAEHDPIRDESEAYAHRLRDAGVDVLLRREPKMIHNFLQLDDVSPAARAAADRVAADVAARLGPGA